MDTPRFIVAIPARHAASRLPGKPLRLIGGTPMVLHVARRALAAGADAVWVATDDARIAEALQGSGVHIAMTSPDHASGTDRLAECAAIAGWADDAMMVSLCLFFVNDEMRRYRKWQSSQVNDSLVGEEDEE